MLHINSPNLHYPSVSRMSMTFKHIIFPMHLSYWILDCPGLTETCGPTTVCFPDEMCMVGTVGPVSVYSELRLEEVPEMGYSPLDDPPCGEVCVRGKTLFSGYYKNPDLTRESIIDGWFHTG